MSLLSKAVFAISMCMFIGKLKQAKKTYLGLISIYLFYLIYVTITQSADYIRLIPIYMKISGVIMLCAPYMSTHNKEITLILSSSFRIVVILNFIQMILLPGLISEDGYLIASNYNQFGSIMCITMILAFLEYNYTRNYLKMLLTFGICLLTVAIPGSMTATLAIVLMIIFFMFNVNIKLKKILATSVLLFIIFFLAVFVIAQNFQIYSDISISNVVEKLGKDVTFSGRTLIWFYALTTIFLSPITGSGYYDVDWALINIQGVNSHNLFLDITVQGGIVLLIYFIFLLGYVISNIKRANNKYIGVSLLFTLYVFLLMSQMEVYNYFMIFILFFVLIIGSQFDDSRLMQISYK